MKSLIDNLVKIGMNTNEARIVDARLKMGPSGASEIHSRSGVPRNKVYEIMDRFVQTGLIELQPGRPLLYMISDPNFLISDLMENYRKVGEDIKIQLSELSERNDENDTAYAWIVKEREPARRKLADLFYRAKEGIFWIGGFPSEYADHMTSSLRTAAKRNINTRVVCMVKPMETGRPDIIEDGIVEFRAIRDFTKGELNMDRRDMEIMGGFRDTAGFGGVAMIDESIAFNIVDEGRFPEKVTGILIKAPGAPRIQKETIERILSL